MLEIKFTCHRCGKSQTVTFKKGGKVLESSLLDLIPKRFTWGLHKPDYIECMTCNNKQLKSILKEAAAKGELINPIA